MKKILRLECMGTDGEGAGKCLLGYDISATGMRLAPPGELRPVAGAAAAARTSTGMCTKCEAKGIASRRVMLRLDMSTQRTWMKE